jgi:hypothetical protein
MIVLATLALLPHLFSGMLRAIFKPLITKLRLTYFLGYVVSGTIYYQVIRV